MYVCHTECFVLDNSLLYPDLKSVMHYANDTIKFGVVWLLYVCLFTTFNGCTNSVPHYENYIFILLFSGVLDGMCDCWNFICFECM